MKENDLILHQIVSAILFLGKQGLALRGDKEDISVSTNNPGNFLALLKMISLEDPVLCHHLHTPRLKNATYLSPRIQNEIINIIGNDIVNEINRFFFSDGR